MNSPPTPQRRREKKTNRNFYQMKRLSIFRSYELGQLQNQSIPEPVSSRVQSGNQKIVLWKTKRMKGKRNDRLNNNKKLLQRYHGEFLWDHPIRSMFAKKNNKMKKKIHNIDIDLDGLVFYLIIFVWQPVNFPIPFVRLNSSIKAKSHSLDKFNIYLINVNIL